MHEQTDSVGQSSQTHVSKPDSDNGVPIWPKIQLSAEFKEDIRKAFLLFDRNGEGTVDVDAVRVSGALGPKTLMFAGKPTLGPRSFSFQVHIFGHMTLITPYHKFILLVRRFV
ncbi:unnamed protein product [Calicophoron daubneyi]|uniref:EF-hand domain-containing protein n=1 Tax=Calicophoron daubneyi TaxID=300641 RepID=A0AAV2TUH1_CALDB